jgi:8-oxo-dGTP diphosphatase
MNKKKYCLYCATPLIIKYIEGKNRFFCPSCQEPFYENPVPVAACVVFNENHEVLLVKRSVEPKKGEWCLPGGFVELEEEPEQAALRELKEETGLKGRNIHLLTVLTAESKRYTSVLMIGYLIDQVQGTIMAGYDSEEAAYFKLKEIPVLAFRSHRLILAKAMEIREKGFPQN